MRALLVLLFLTACSANGPQFGELNLSKADQPALVVYRPSHLWASGNFFEIDIDGVPTCKIFNGGFYVAKNIKNKTVNVSSSMFAVPGTSRILVDIEPKKTHYVKIELNDSKQAMGIGAGLVGMLVAEGGPDPSGPFIFTLVDEDQAKRDLKSIRLEENC